MAAAVTAPAAATARAALSLLLSAVVNASMKLCVALALWFSGGVCARPHELHASASALLSWVHSRQFHGFGPASSSTASE
jgi:hypothetical protein